jgi:hypothetical protein
MISGLPRPAIAGSASRAPSWAALRIKGRGLISVFIGENPEMTMPAVMVTGKGRAAIVSAAAARSSAGKASRRANACSRSDAFDESISAVFAIAK